MMEQYSKHLALKDEEVIKLRGEVDTLSSQLFSKQQEHDSLTFTKTQLEKRLQMATEKGN